MLVLVQEISNNGHCRFNQFFILAKNTVKELEIYCFYQLKRSIYVNIKVYNFFLPEMFIHFTVTLHLHPIFCYLHYSISKWKVSSVLCVLKQIQFNNIPVFHCTFCEISIPPTH